MADACDYAKEYQDLHVELSLERHKRMNQPGQGRPDCLECGEAVSPLRQGLGAVRCIDCQQDHERMR